MSYEKIREALNDIDALDLSALNRTQKIFHKTNVIKSRIENMTLNDLKQLEHKLNLDSAEHIIVVASALDELKLENNQQSFQHLWKNPKSKIFNCLLAQYMSLIVNKIVDTLVKHGSSINSDAADDYDIAQFNSILRDRMNESHEDIKQLAILADKKIGNITDYYLRQCPHEVEQKRKEFEDELLRYEDQMKASMGDLSGTLGVGF